MRKKTKEMEEHLERIKNTVNKNVARELEEDFNSQVVTQDLDKQREPMIDFGRDKNITDDIFLSNNSNV